MSHAPCAEEIVSPVQSSSPAVFLMLFLFAYAMFPLMSAFVFFPACAVDSAETKPVRIFYAFRIFHNLSAGNPLVKKHSFVIVIVFSACVSDIVSRSSPLAFTCTAVVAFPSHNFVLPFCAVKNGSCFQLMDHAMRCTYP